MDWSEIVVKSKKVVLFNSLSFVETHIFTKGANFINRILIKKFNFVYYGIVK